MWALWGFEIGHTWQHNLSDVIKATMSIVIPLIPTVVSVGAVVGLGTPKKVIRRMISSLAP